MARTMSRMAAPIYRPATTAATASATLSRMRRLPFVAAIAAIAAIALASCGGDESGVEGSEILQPYESLSGGIIFASAAIIDSNDYDLYWAPVPLQPTTL